jgi:hypothetical protein
MRGLTESRRVWLPFAGAVLCLVATSWAGSILTWVLLLAAVALLFDGVTLLWSRSGGMTQHRQ